LKPKYAVLKLILAANLIGFMYAGCARVNRDVDEAPEISVTVELEPDPAKVGAGQFLIHLNDADQQAVTGADIRLRGDMTHPGMVPEIGTAREVEAGIYQVRSFEWTMAGDWVITVQAELADGRQLQRQFEITVENEQSEIE
jgi:hypothetical protein